ncbi:MAG: HNH endonuclease [Elusimicrobia bacterium]|nr:HNH endonuclease [Elusimicrobiota bacterium]
MKRIAAAERTLSVYALAHLAEIQRRKLYADAGFRSMFAYCVGELGYSESNTCRRLQAVEAARKFPETLSLIKSGEISICALAVISKHLTWDNRSDILKRMEGKSLRAVERLAAELAPRPDTRDTIRSLSAPKVTPPAVNLSAIALPVVEPPVVLPAVEPPVVLPAVEPPDVPSAIASVVPSVAPVFAQKIAPRSSERVYFGFTGSEELRGVIDRCKDLLWHKFPAGRLEDVFLELGTSYLKLKDPELLPASMPKPPRAARTRWIPRWVRSKVYRRDEGRCVFTSEDGRRCDARRGLEYDHILPWAMGGRSDDPDNIRLLCRAHNEWAAKAAGLA